MGGDSVMAGRRTQLPWISDCMGPEPSTLAWSGQEWTFPSPDGCFLASKPLSTPSPGSPIFCDGVCHRGRLDVPHPTAGQV